eukprot:TRINITY_DN62128_c0_g1_i1.p1 TRINITY_DN62128_c0_g1~~TRINITY_DN62128_c0_g1_i1.p1  ORF type:complete len:316 (-),score=73.27 TRINITY_DN62128_c0_g1_i1:61-1008(-)
MFEREAAPLDTAPMAVSTARASTISSGARGSSDADEDERVLCAAFAELSSEASQIERMAIDLDRAGDAEQAVAVYQQAAERLKKAAAACPEGNPDRAVLARHAGEVLGRVVYLESLCGATASVPPEAHIGCERLFRGQIHGPQESDGFQVVQPGSPENEQTGAQRTLRQKAASAAAVSGGVGLLVLHAPVCALGLAAGAAYATTRKDSAGEAARSMGDMGIQAADHVRTVAQEHRVSERVDSAMDKVRSLDQRFRVSERTQAAATSSAEALKELNRKHKVTEKVSHGAVKATEGLGQLLSPAASWVSRKVASRLT